MKIKSLILLLIIGLTACNDSQNDKELNKKLGSVDSVNTTVVRPDTTTLTTNIVAPDTARAKTTDQNSPVSLQNFWVLESVDGKTLDPKDFPSGTPYFELNPAKKKVKGYAGCNSMSGSITVEGNTIIFGKLITTKASCKLQEFENNYVKALSGQKIPYSIAGTKLILTISPNSKYIYRKMQ